MARPAGLEPATTRLEGGCSIQLSYGRLTVRPPEYPEIGRGREIRTPDILLPKQARYQTALYPDTAWMLPLECWLSNRKAFLPEMRSRRPQILLNLCDQRQRHCTNIAQAVIIWSNYKAGQ